MSQSNENTPSFNFVVNEPYFHDDQHSQPWPPVRLQTVQYSIPSPSTSVRSAMTVPNLRFPDVSGFDQSNVFQQQFGISPSSSFLAPPGPGHMLTRHFQEGPWDPLCMNGVPELQYQSTIDYGAIRAGRAFDMESMPDSGYGPSAYGSTGTKPTRSIISNEPDSTNQELHPDVTRQVARMGAGLTHDEVLEMTRIQSDQVSNHNSHSSLHGNQLKCSLPDCDEMFKCPSDYKKHMLKHNKPYRCDFPGCKRIGGFTTTNDRDRHKKSVHKIGLGTDGKSFKCASKDCQNKDKWWPRYDNFKQHVERMHEGEDLMDLVKRSLQRSADSTLAGDAHSVTPMDNSLAFAGLGTESTYTEGHQDELISPISLAAGQGDSRCTFGLDDDGLTMDIDQPSMQPHQSFSTTKDPRSRNVEKQGTNQSRTQRPPKRGELSKMRETATKNVTPKPNHSNTHSSKPYRRTAQTKADQQKVASQRLSKINIGQLQKPVSPESDAANLEYLAQLVLNQTRKTAGQDPDMSVQQDQGFASASAEGNDTTILTKDKLVQVLSDLLKQNSNPVFPLPHRSSHGNVSRMEKCPDCPYEARPSDLRKHIKRHNKPYGCTYPECYKHFGAKSDWKRHENSQHFQLEAFRCKQKCLLSDVTCGRYFRGPEQFKKHLETHSKSWAGKSLQDEVKRCKIGKNYQVQFWCGFCCEIKPLVEKRNAAWDERFNHIAEHFDKDEKSIDDWVCVEKNRKKRELELEYKNKKKRQVESDNKAEDVDAVGEIDDSPPPNVDVDMAPLLASKDLPLQQGLEPANIRKRQAPEDPTPLREKRIRVERTRYCCFCDDGPYSSMQASCMSCGEAFCDSCKFVDVNFPVEGDVRE